ncbi:tyrosine-type recombinase/integrase [Rhodanobacter sp. 115]|uniref:tyrosine-type recombinase/integrase n=1 Tax=Rhodanobacter sp. FW021-MT20 TaxID=1162282 RepID=UPI0034E61ACB
MREHTESRHTLSMTALKPMRAFPAAEIFPTTIRRAPVESGAAIEAKTDADAVVAWLSQFASKANTFANCRKEAERFMLWIGSQGKALADVRHEDVMGYREFLANPPQGWVSRISHSRNDLAWRPFRGPLSPASIRQAEIVLSGMFTWLTEARYLALNPFALSRRPRDVRTRKVARFLTPSQLQIVLDTVDDVPADGDERRAARDRWLIRLLYLTGLRVSEAVGHTMGHLVRRQTPTGTRWKLCVVGKGDKEREIPATKAFMEALHTFRVAWGLSPLPFALESTPLLPSLRGGGHLTRTGAYRALEAIFARAAERCSDQRDAANIRLASPHWMRHSRGTHLVADDASLKTVQELLGHASLTTTSQYVHDELDRIHDDIERAETLGRRVPA